MSTKILVVDDSQVDRRLVAGLLNHGAGYLITEAENGRQALKRVAHERPDLVITDLVMPEMDGLELVSTMRRKLPQIPVILLTAHGSEETALKALQGGAASYVPKARQAERLRETVERVLARCRAERHDRRVAGCLIEFHCKYLLENDPALVRPLVDQIQQTMADVGTSDDAERIRTCMALEEAILNAMYHGNLKITADELDQARSGRRPGGLARLVHRRRLNASDKRATLVKVHIQQDGARFVIRDEGRGFAAQPALNCRLADYFENGRHHGVMLMRSLMDDVKYNDRGNEVTLSKHYTG